MRANAQTMKTAVKPVSVAIARFLWVASCVMIDRLIDMAINTRPARAAAPPPTIRKKFCHSSIAITPYDTRKKMNRVRGFVDNDASDLILIGPSFANIGHLAQGLMENPAYRKQGGEQCRTNCEATCR